MSSRQHIRPGLLPPNSTPLERCMDYALGRIDEIPTPLGALWSIEGCPEDLLPWLAWTLGVEDWGRDWPVEIKRRAIAAAYDIHRLRGTPAAVKRLLDSIGAIYDFDEPAPLQYRIRIWNSEALVIDDVQGLTSAVRRADRLAARGTIQIAAGLTGAAHIAGGIAARQFAALDLPVLEAAA